VIVDRARAGAVAKRLRASGETVWRIGEVVKRGKSGPRVVLV
jgi:phosphoribosylaminoimidazole (AIR) synthetase